MMSSLCFTHQGGHGFNGQHPVPGSLDGITSEWCEWALRKGGTIGSKTTVTSVIVKRFKNEETGVLDGGGFGGAMIVRITLNYGGQTTGNEPASVVCKLSLGGQHKMPFKLRAFMRMNPGAIEENLFRNEISFVENVIPKLKESGYQYPAIYYSGILDGGTRGFVSHAVFDSKIKVTAVILMEDMAGWKSKMPGDSLQHDELVAILRNSAVMHAAFWGNETQDSKRWFKYPANAESQSRGSSYSWITTKFRNSGISSSSVIKKQMTKLIDNWGSTNSFTLKRDKYVPEWITIKPLDDGGVQILKDPVITELVEVMSQRFPDFNKHVTEPYFKLPNQTLLHGDCHVETTCIMKIVARLLHSIFSVRVEEELHRSLSTSSV